MTKLMPSVLLLLLSISCSHGLTCDEDCYLLVSYSLDDGETTTEAYDDSDCSSSDTTCDSGESCNIVDLTISYGSDYTVNFVTSYCSSSSTISSSSCDTPAVGAYVRPSSSHRAFGQPGLRADRLADWGHFNVTQECMYPGLNIS
eukprot:sb/3473948/